MSTNWILTLCVLVYTSCDLIKAYHTNQWALHIEGGPDTAKLVASHHGFRYLDKISGDWYHVEHHLVKKRSIEPHHEIRRRLSEDGRILRAEQQRAKSRSKRDLIIKRGPLRAQTVLNDDRWSQMWYLNRGNGLDMNVQGAWAEGITGQGVVVTILDDGLEKDHPDLLKNYDPEASYDVNNHDEDPMPRYDIVDSNRHGTRCAGEVAATANNSICAVGVAFGAVVGGVRMLDGDVTDAVEARSLSLNPQHIDIYSASWGPDDDGKTVDGPGELATRAFIEGITKGRGGKGSIFVWASGNGGRDHDNCNCDGYTNSIWTLSISSATENGLVPWYSEACSSTLATTYSSGATGEKQVITTDLHHQCTSSHTGTSASAPLAAGICALALEANRDLTWRDMQHIVVRTAKPANLKAPDWVTNGIGRNVSHSFGYGLMDATAMVRLARKWRTVPEQHKCEMLAPHTQRNIPAKSQLVLELHVKECSDVNFLEHVQAKVTLTSQRRGDLQIQLTSPQGTKSTLLAKRPHDVSKAGFHQWPFMSVHTWGERPHGTWKLEIHNEGRYVGRAMLHEWALIFYGTSTPPDRSEFALYNPSVISMPRKPFVKPRETNFLKNQNLLHPKNKQSQSQQHKAEKSSNVFVMNSGNQGQRKNKARGQHKNGKMNRPTSRPTIQTLRGLTAVRGPKAGDERTKERGRSTPSPLSPTTTTALPSTKALTIQQTEFSRPRSSEQTTVSSVPQRGIILMEPPKAAINKVPAVFQKYPKIQQLYPLFPVYTGPRGIDQHTARANGLDLLQDEQFDSRNLQLDKASLVNWELVFYGTEMSLEVDDELDKDNDDLSIVRGGSIGDSSGENRHNLVDSNAERPWTGNQQIERVSHPEARKPTAENHTGSDSAPMVSTSGCRRFDDVGRCLECGVNWYLYDGHCVSPCPIKTYSVSDGVNSVCSRCHYTCETCSGPSEAECTSCQADATFVSSRCILQSVAWQIQFTKWHIVLTALLVIDLLALITGAVYFYMRSSAQKNASQHDYSSIAYSVTGKKPVDEEKMVLWGNDSESE